MNFNTSTAVVVDRDVEARGVLMVTMAIMAARAIAAPAKPKVLLAVLQRNQ
jgi:hypothetical protein